MVDGMLERIEESIGQSVTTVATGGNAPRILRYCKRPIQYDADLIMTGRVCPEGIEKYVNEISVVSTGKNLRISQAENIDIDNHQE